MKICGLEKLSLVDYDGNVSAVVFTGGCNYKCPFCHNSGLANNTVEAFSKTEVLEFLKQRKNMLDAVCISGGEPTLWEDLPNFIHKVKEMGYLVKLDTNGTNPQMLQKLINEKLINYVAMDIKTSLEKYPLVAGVENAKIENVIKSVNILMQNNIPYEFRTTLVKEFHSVNDIAKMAEQLKGAKKLFLQQYKSSENCINPNLTPVDKETALCFIEILQQTIHQVNLRGYA